MALLSQYLIKRRYHAIKPYLSGDILDLGCGRGIVASMVDRSRKYIGIELSQAHVLKLQGQFPHGTFYCRDLDRERLDVGDAKFDTVLALAVIEHLERPRWLLSQLAACIKPSGHLLITTPSLWGDRMLSVGARLGLFHPDGIAGHRGVYQKPEMDRLLVGTGLCLVKSRLFLFGANQLFVCRPEGEG